METRRASPADLDAIGSLLGEAHLAPLPPHFPLADVLVALEDSTVIGVVALEVSGLQGWIRTVAVAPQRRNRGVGTSLLLSLQSRGHVLGLREIDVLPNDAQRFFERAGFAAVPGETVPAAIRSLRGFREQSEESTQVMRLCLAKRYL